MNLICLEMNEGRKRLLPRRTIASHKLHASEYETIYCKNPHSNQQIRQQLSALLKSTDRMPGSMLADKKNKTISSHHDNPLRSLRCASYALKWMDEANTHYLGQPSHLTNH